MHMHLAKTLPPPPANHYGWPWAEIADGRKLVGSRIHKQLPRVTIVTPSFNQGKYIEATIRSILLQRYPNLQYIVVDGGSQDCTSEVLEHYAEFIDHVIREPDNGQSDAICKGLDLADGELFNWINSDDLLAPDTLWLLAEATSKAADLYAFDVQAFDDARDLYVMENRNLTAKAMLRADHYAFSQPGLWFRMDHLLAAGGIDPTFHYGFDWDLLVRYLACHDRVMYLSKIGAYFRLHESSKTMTETARIDQAENRFKQEANRIRTKIEASLPERLATDSRLGRLREPWNQQIVEMLDHKNRSPIITLFQMLRAIVADPKVKLSSRSLGAILRLMSRYIRPKFYHRGR
jgi:glycosyltransferase involved in cell wall biosynthesis